MSVDESQKLSCWSPGRWLLRRNACEWTPLYERRRFATPGSTMRWMSPVFRCARGKLLGEKGPSESRIFLKF